ncbi:alpha/beta hydrolase [Heyndrickxia sporothermodurans]|uniref:alpha/beta fold hydrolase n=1 Tax=Heyndrickxia TaxID=2837504 RepID=UPI002DB7EB12|nr:alpha/beta hydrolase [Heyndrickxia sporothermodurans]MEB6550484.1 alpha/beta hydrolase [Heyndrickxia sporothermodurans]MED3654943.1 alpha/beta hydrolase [Heyndrickxia sporothermodurans]MED3780086.1 alpha/beta hydrolase [Heyndrickxia sporothermodurans]
MFIRKTSAIQNGPNSIASLEAMTIGGVEQWVLIRGQDRRKPILLWVHGGPGAAQIGFISQYTSEYEKDFLVVNWDQRGAGLSYSKKITEESMTLERMLNDLIELVRKLCARFQQDKVYILGHSWGTVLSYLAIKRHPELFHGYISVSQIVNWKQLEHSSYEQTLQKAKEVGNEKAYTQLIRIGAPPWDKVSSEHIHNHLLQKLGGGVIHKGSFMKLFLLPLFKRPEYHLFDVIKWLKGQWFSKSSLKEEAEAIDLYQDDLSIQIPIAFCNGRYDYTCPGELAEDFYYKLQAPVKKWIWFEQSAHTPMIEEAESFQRFVLDTLKEWHKNFNE